MRGRVRAAPPGGVGEGLREGSGRWRQVGLPGAEPPGDWPGARGDVTRRGFTLVQVEKPAQPRVPGVGQWFPPHLFRQVLRSPSRLSAVPPEPCPAAGLAGLLVQAPSLGRGQWSAAVGAHRTLSQPRRALPRPPASQPSSAQVGRDQGHPADGETPDSGALSLRPHSAEGSRQLPLRHHHPWTAALTQFEVSPLDCLLHTGQPPRPNLQDPTHGHSGCPAPKGP